MSLVPMDNENMVRTIRNDAQQLRTFIDWARVRYSVYNQNCTTDNMTAAGIASGDQAFVLAFIGDLNRIQMLAAGTLPGNADDMNFNINALLGLV